MSHKLKILAQLGLFGYVTATFHYFGKNHQGNKGYPQAPPFYPGIPENHGFQHNTDFGHGVGYVPDSGLGFGHDFGHDFGFGHDSGYEHNSEFGYNSGFGLNSGFGHNSGLGHDSGFGSHYDNPFEPLNGGFPTPEFGSGFGGTPNFFNGQPTTPFARNMANFLQFAAGAAKFIDRGLPCLSTKRRRHGHKHRRKQSDILCYIFG